MKNKKIKFMTFLLVIFNIISPAIMDAQELKNNKNQETDLVTKNSDVDNENQELKVDNKKDDTGRIEKSDAIGVGKSNPTDIVNIPDESLKGAINQQIGNSLDADITVEDMESLKRLEINTYNPPIKDLTGLEYAINLEKLDAQTQAINNIEPLKDLVNLKHLILSDNNISDISSLENLKNLEYLKLSNNNITDISSLANLVNMYTLELRQNNINDISVLQNLPKLFFLDIANNKITDISPLQNLTGLSLLDIENNQIIDVSSAPTSITIFLAGNQVVTIDAGAISIPEYENLEYNAIERDGTKIPLDLGVYDLNGGTKELSWSSETDAFSGKIHFNYKILTEAPKIYGTKDLELTLGDTIDLLAGISADDAEDGDLTDKLQVDDSEVDYNKTGKYNVTYSVTDSMGKTTTETITLTIKRDVTIPVTPLTPKVRTMPIIEGTTNKVANINTSIDYLVGVSANDAEDGNLTNKIKVDDSKVDYSKVGTYEVTYSVVDSDGNTTKKTITVELVDEVELIKIDSANPNLPKIDISSNNSTNGDKLLNTAINLKTYVVITVTIILVVMVIIRQRYYKE